MDFSKALKELKDGKALHRSGWSGQGQFIYYVPEGKYEPQTKIDEKTFGKEVPYAAYIAMKTNENTVVPWLASQTDLLAEDWLVI